MEQKIQLKHPTGKKNVRIDKGEYDSDVPESFGKATIGNNFYIAINTESEDEADKLFKALSAGGEVTMPLDKAFWGAYFGMLKDKFGIQ